jgi:hypothetical protein
MVLFRDAIPAVEGGSIARRDHAAAWLDSAAMNPRYRRMVIPGALVALMLLVVVTALVRR